MYRQPENTNRVKSMKNRFEGLNDTGFTQRNTDKVKKTLPTQNTNLSKQPVASSLNKVSKYSQKKEHNNNNNNNHHHHCGEKYLNKDSSKENNLNLNKGFSCNTMKPNTSNGKSKFEEKSIVVEKDFSNVNKKELCTVPPLNLTRQLNDPTAMKKGCIKRTPAFRKDKQMNSSKSKANDFTSIINMFENNDKSTCDMNNVNNIDKNLSRLCCSDSDIKSEITKIKYFPKKNLTSTVSLDGQSNNYHSDFMKSQKQNNDENNKTAIFVSKHKLTTSVSLNADNTLCEKINDDNDINNISFDMTLKISDKEQSQVKELLDNLTNNYQEHETKVNDNNKFVSAIPAYAQIDKTKKTCHNKKDLFLTETLKLALSQPLPSGPPPKKPPRTFAHTSNSPVNPKLTKNDKNQIKSSSTNNLNSSVCDDKLTVNLTQGFRSKTPDIDKKPDKMTKIKSDPKLMLQKLENALLNNKIKSPKLPRKLKSSLDIATSSKSPTSQSNLYTNESSAKNLFPNCLTSLNCISNTPVSNAYSKNTSSKSSSALLEKRCIATSSRNQEPIYAEPFQFKQNEDSSNLSTSSLSSRHLCNSSGNKTDTISNSLHYMSNPVCEWNSASNQSECRVTAGDNVNNSDTTFSKNDKCVSFYENGPLTRHKLNLIMNHTYASPSPTDSDIDSLPSTPSSEDTPSNIKRGTIKELILNFEQKHQLEPNTLHIPAAVKQRLTVSTTSSTGREEEVHVKSKEVPPSFKNKVIKTSSGGGGVGDDISSIDDKKLYKAQLNRTLTEIRKTYVKRVSSTVRRKPEQIVVTAKQQLFECCLLVELDVVNLLPYIKKKYPPDYSVPPWIEHLCFPDATEWSTKPQSVATIPKIQSIDCQCYSLVLTNEKGDRKFGYCRRVVPEETSVCLPLAYCIISTYRATGFYHKVLQELESRHGLPFGLQEMFVKELYNCQFPQPGESIKVPCSLRTLVVNSCNDMIDTRRITDPDSIKFIVNMQNGIYGHLNKVAPNRNSILGESSNSSDNNNNNGNGDDSTAAAAADVDDGNNKKNWLKLDSPSSAAAAANNDNVANDRCDFKTPKMTYGTAGQSTSGGDCGGVLASNSFSKIQKYANDFKRSSNSFPGESQNSVDNIIRQLNAENSFTACKSNTSLRNFESPLITKRMARLWDNDDDDDDNTVVATTAAAAAAAAADNNGEIVTLKRRDNSPVVNQTKQHCSAGDSVQYPLLNLPDSQLLHDCLIGDVLLKRPYDSRLEDVDLTMLFNTLDLTTLLQTFGSLLHERKVIFISSTLSKLSSCVEALQSILYPFSWQHTFIPVLSNNMLDILCAPLPLIAGVLASHITETLIIEEGIAVNLDTSSLICYMGDENEIIPKRLQKGLIVGLQLVTEATQSDDRSRNVLVSEAFIRMFVEACGCYKQYIIANETGQKLFERELFIKHHQAKCVNLFLEWFTETAMFNSFIQSRLDGEPSETMFEQRCVELNCEKNSAALLKNSKVTQKMKQFGHKLFH